MADAKRLAAAQSDYFSKRITLPSGDAWPTRLRAESWHWSRTLTEAPLALLHGSLRFERLLARNAYPLKALGEAVAMDRTRESQVLVRERERLSLTKSKRSSLWGEWCRETSRRVRRLEGGRSSGGWCAAAAGACAAHAIVQALTATAAAPRSASSPASTRKSSFHTRPRLAGSGSTMALAG